MQGERDPMVDAAKARVLVRLDDGQEGRLMRWPLACYQSNGSGKALILIAGHKHIRVAPERVVEVVYEDTTGEAGES